MTTPARLIAPPAAFVLHGRPLRAGVDLETTSTFTDDVWDLEPANHQAHSRRWILNFQSLPAAFRPVAKELFLELLASPRCTEHDRLSLSTIRGIFSRVKKFLTWVDENHPGPLQALTGGQLLGYVSWLQRQPIMPEKRGGHRSAVRLFWIHRAWLTTDCLAIDPQGLPDWDAEPSRARRSENSTDRIPEEVISPLLVWALRWVQDFSADILAAREQWWALHLNGPRHRGTYRPRSSYGDTQRRLAKLLARYRADGRPLPGRPDGGVNGLFLARQIDRPHSMLRSAAVRQLITDTAAQVGIADDAYLDTTIHGLLDGEPWLPRIRYAEVPHLSRLLHVACYIVIAYLSGMRDSEVKHLRRGCLGRKRDSDGSTYRRTLTSQAFKNEGQPEGVTAAWVVGAPVERAIKVLGQLLPDNHVYLFSCLPGSLGFRGDSPTSAMTTSQTNKSMADFVEWVSTYCRRHQRPDAIPLVRKQRWRLSTSQFRRTLAWFIARRPGGSIAGAIQYRHQSIQMFEGYAGTSDSGFRAEVEAEQSLERGERLLAMIDGHHHIDLRGPAAEEAQMRMEIFASKTGYAGSVVIDPKRLARIMKRDDPKIYFGKFVTCVHNPDRALCSRQDFEGNATGLPDLGTCQPLRCRNVALSNDNTHALARQLDRLDVLLVRHEVLPPYVSHRLRQQREDLAALLAAGINDQRNL
ncbi:hypothetical protein [Micromonospora sp. RV43]|uniref:hypothetical protein n=1 Tax=Micromonospora sp. RV43 TaxID=1661387 RepID=UPI00064BCF18|nr:hypothetical protein [Micromonospora sp. RV43]